jgi:hypothetical protein
MQHLLRSSNRVKEVPFTATGARRVVESSHGIKGHLAIASAAQQEMLSKTARESEDDHDQKN